jgi:hypothetical protein
METFRDDLLGVFFVSQDGTFAFEVTRSGASAELIVSAYRRPKGAAAEERVARETAVCLESRGASFTPPSDPTSTFGPARLGVLSLSLDSDYTPAVYVMFGGPPATGAESAFPWVAIRPVVTRSEVAAFPYYRGSFMDSMTGDFWLDDHDDPSYWHSPQRVYRPHDVAASDLTGAP